MQAKVLITRPIDQAKSFADDIRTLGAQPVFAPLLSVAPVPFVMPPILPDALIVTSVNGFPANVNSEWKNLPLFVVGDAVAQHAKEMGFGRIVAIAAQAAELVISIRRSYFRDFIYWGGQDITYNFMRAIPEKAIARAVTYQAVAKDAFPPEVLRSFAELQVVTLFSARTAQIFCDVVKSSGLENHLSQINLLCLSRAVLDSVSYKNWRSVQIADSPDQVAMITALQQILQDDI